MILLKLLLGCQYFFIFFQKYCYLASIKIKYFFFKCKQLNKIVNLNLRIILQFILSILNWFNSILSFNYQLLELWLPKDFCLRKTVFLIFFFFFVTLWVFFNFHLFFELILQILIWVNYRIYFHWMKMYNFNI